MVCVGERNPRKRECDTVFREAYDRTDSHRNRSGRHQDRRARAGWARRGDCADAHRDAAARLRGHGAGDCSGGAGAGAARRRRRARSSLGRRGDSGHDCARHRAGEECELHVAQRPDAGARPCGCAGQARALRQRRQLPGRLRGNRRSGGWRGAGLRGDSGHRLRRWNQRQRSGARGAERSLRRVGAQSSALGHARGTARARVLLRPARMH